MKKLNLLIIALVIQCSVFSQIPNDILDKTFPEFNNSNVELLMRGDTIIILDSTIAYRYDEETTMPLAKVLFKTYDDQGRNIVRVYYMWDIDTEEFYVRSIDSTIYFDDNSVKEYFMMMYSSVNDEMYRAVYELNNEEGYPLIDESIDMESPTDQLAEGRQQINTYEDGIFLLRRQDNLYDNNSEWRNESLEEYVRDDEGLILERKSSNFDTITNVWVNSILHKYFRDENGNDTLKLTDHWNIETNTWMPSAKHQKTFNEDNQFTFELELKWDNDLVDWEFKASTDVIYSQQGDRDTVTHSQYDSEYGFWHYTKRHCFSFDDDHIMTYRLVQDYDFVQEKWNNEDRFEWKYEDGRIDFHLFEEWKYNAWFGKEKTYYSYIEDGTVDTIIAYHSSGFGEEWDYGTRQSYSFNEDGLRSIFNYETLNDSYEWVTENKQFYYYSTLVLPNAISELSDFEFSIYPNPTTGQLSIELPEGLDGNTIVLINDMNGRTIKTLPISYENNLIDLSSQPTGIYFVQILNGTKAGTKKIILK